MKKITLIVCFSTLMYSQSNENVGNVYIKRAEKKIKEEKSSEAIKNYSKAMKYIDSEKNSNTYIPKLGMVLYANANNYPMAKEYSKDYFKLVSDKTTDEFLKMLELYVDIVDKLEDQDIESTQVKKASPNNDNHYNFDNIIKSIKVKDRKK